VPEQDRFVTLESWQGRLTAANGPCQNASVHSALPALVGILLLALPATSMAQNTPPTTQTETQSKSAQADQFKELIAVGRRELSHNAAGKAELLFRQAIKLAPKSAVAHNELGVALFQQGAAVAAVEPFKKATKLDPTLASAWANLGEAQRRIREYKKAAYAFHRFLKLEKNDPFALFGLGVSFEGSQSLKKALKTLNIAQKYADRGDIDALSARITQAIQRVHREILDARRPAVARGDDLVRAGRYRDGLNVYINALQERPKDAVLLGRVGLVKAILGEVKGAEESLRAALMNDPAEPVARAAYATLLRFTATEEDTDDLSNERGQALLGADRAALAFRVFAQQLANAPDDEEARKGHGEAALRLRRLDAAAADFELAGDDVVALSGLAETQHLQGKTQAAQQTLKRTGKRISLQHLSVWRQSLLTN